MKDDHKTKALNTDFGQKVTVERAEGTNVLIQRAANSYKELGATLNPQPDALQYMGTMIMNIYLAPTIGQAVFVSQLPLGECSEELASKALEALRGDCMVAFGRKRSTRRSGF